MSERISSGLLLLLLLQPTLPAQTLAEAARKEAERRSGVGAQQRETDVLTNDELLKRAKRGNVGLFSPERSKTGLPGPSADLSRGSPERFIRALQKIDREIRQVEERLTSLRERERRERWSLPPVGRIARSSAASKDYRPQIRELESKLEGLRSERREVYDQGRRAGFYPGELDVRRALR
jgi:chromosome segregation ATPase